MLETYFWLGAGIAVFALLTQLVILWLYAAALRRHRHKCFLVLSSSCFLGLIYSVLMGVPYIAPMDEPSLVTLTAIGAFVGAVGVSLSIWGTILLLKSYRNLTEAVAQSSAGGA